MVVDDEGSPTRRVWLDGDPREAVRFFARAD
jgi:hypothetical protein